MANLRKKLRLISDRSVIKTKGQGYIFLTAFSAMDSSA